MSNEKVKLKKKEKHSKHFVAPQILLAEAGILNDPPDINNWVSLILDEPVSGKLYLLFSDTDTDITNLCHHILTILIIGHLCRPVSFPVIPNDCKL